MATCQVQQPTQQFYSADQLWELSHSPEYADKRLELAEGVLIEMPPAGGLHGEDASEANWHIRSHVKQNNLGYVTAAETGYILFKSPDGKDTVRAPDVSFVAKERLPDGMPDEYIPLAPDLVVEVVSPNDKATEIQDKINDYLRYGTRLVWVMYPKSKTVNVFSPTASYHLTIDDVLDGGDVLPGFRLPLRELFST